MTDASVELWLADLNALAEPLTRLEERNPLCPTSELEQFDEPRAIARMALRRLIARCFGRDVAARAFVPGAHGKPALPGLGGDFNLSHTSLRSEPLRPENARSLALIGLGRVCAIGVDLEPLRSVQLDARRRALIIKAALVIGGGVPLPDGDEKRILQAWARLEAWGKADGRGIGRTLKHFGIWGADRGETCVDIEQTSLTSGLVVHDVAAGSGFFAAVALPGGVEPPKIGILPADPGALDIILCRPESCLNSSVDLASGAGQKGRIGA